MNSRSERRTTPKVSVVITTYKRQDVLPRAIKSVLGQTMTDWELLVVDDEPSSDTARIVGSITDPRVRYVAHPENRGLSAARNTGIRQARGDYLAFLDDDDVFLERKLESQSAVLDQRDEHVGVVSCFELVGSPGSAPSQRAITLDGDVHGALLRQDLVRMQLLMVRSVCFDRVGLFDERLRAHDDFDMTLRLSRAFHFATVAQPLVRIIGTPGSMSTNVQNRIDALEMMFRSHPELRERRRIRARWQRRMARHHAELRNRSEWRRWMLGSLRSDPASLPTLTAWIAGEILGPASHLRLGRVRGRVARTAGWASRR